MNYYQYKRRAPKRSGSDYIKPFLVIIIFAAVIYAGWNLLSSVLIDGDTPLSSEKVLLDIESGSAKAMTAGDAAWKNVPTSIYLYEGEKVKTLADGRVSLSFFDDTTVRLDKSSQLSLTSLASSGITASLDLALEEGKLWANVDSGGEMMTDFRVRTDLLDLTISQGVVAVSAPGTVYVLSGSAQVGIVKDGKTVKTVTAGVGQQVIVDENIVADLAEDLSKEILFALDDSFRTSNWYRWNRQKDIPLGDTDLSGEATEDSTDLIDSDESLDEAEETEDPDEASEASEAGEEEDLSDDTDPPIRPEIEEPGNNGDTVTLEDVEQDIIGSVSADTEAVIVNDYRLTLYKPGSDTFSYHAKLSYNNLKAGENQYEVIAEDKAGNQSEPALITLVLPQEVIDAAEAEAETEDTAEDSSDNSADSTPAASSTGGVTITSPNNGENLVTSETAFEIRGNVPEGTAKVLVNKYQLQGFSEGDFSFLYRANSTLGTLEIGEVNTYDVEAFDADGELIGTASISIDVESGQNGEAGGAPVITMPSGSGAYETTLDQLVVGGTVGKWATRIRINGVNLDEYIPGSEEWKKTVTLEPGETVYKVCAEKEGVEQGCSSITINYQN